MTQSSFLREIEGARLRRPLEFAAARELPDGWEWHDFIAPAIR
jgi:hypothetical protein